MNSKGLSHWMIAAPIDGDRGQSHAAAVGQRQLEVGPQRSDHAVRQAGFGDGLGFPRRAAVAAGHGHETVLGDDEVGELLAVLLERTDVAEGIRRDACRRRGAAKRNAGRAEIEESGPCRQHCGLVAGVDGT